MSPVVFYPALISSGHSPSYSLRELFKLPGFYLRIYWHYKQDLIQNECFMMGDNRYFGQK